MSNNTALDQAREVWFGPGDFTRKDESPDAAFYQTDRMVSHLDSTALQTVRQLIGSLITEERPDILDLMASWDSHLPEGLQTGRVSGLGMNRNELRANPALTDYVLHDLNADPRLPYEDASFDVVLNVVSVDYLTRPLEVFSEVGRVLRPGGLLLVVFSDRWFEPKVTNLWRNCSETERICLVEELMRGAGSFEAPRTWASKGRPRPAGDKYAELGIPSDPVIAVFAQRCGGPARPARPLPRPPERDGAEQELYLQRLEQVPQTLRCPHCGEKLGKWEVPQTPFTEWDNEYMHICFNDRCPYLQNGWEAMARQGNFGSSYRFMYNPAGGACGPMPVQSLQTLKDGRID